MGVGITSYNTKVKISGSKINITHYTENQVRGYKKENAESDVKGIDYSKEPYSHHIYTHEVLVNANVDYKTEPYSSYTLI